MAERTQADKLVEIALRTYELGRSTDGWVFAIPREGPRVLRAIRGTEGALRSELARRFYEMEDKVPSSSAVADALRVLEGMALAGDAYDVHIRVAPIGKGKSVAIDLGRADGTSLVISPRNKWWLNRNGPPDGVLFRRSELTGAMPNPKPGGDINEIDALQRFVHVNDEDWPLVVAWMAAAWIPGIPHPILTLIGEQGTGKSAASKAILNVLDPSSAPTTRQPSDERNWSVIAAATWSIGLENVSSLPDWLSDALCAAVTGTGVVRRALYTDSAVVVDQFRRVIVINGIDLGPLRADFVDRAIVLETPLLTSRERKEDAVLERQFKEALPGILSGQASLVAEVLKCYRRLRPKDLPRMADFARVVYAVDRIRGTEALARYYQMIDEQVRLAIEADAVASTVVALMESRNNREMTGKPAAVYTTLRDAVRQASRTNEVPDGWPADAAALSRRLTRANPSLRRVGYEFSRTQGKEREWSLRKIG